MNFEWACMIGLELGGLVLCGSGAMRHQHGAQQVDAVPIQFSPLIPQCKEVAEHCENESKQTNTNGPRNNMSTNMAAGSNWFFIEKSQSVKLVCVVFSVQWPLTVTLKEKHQIEQQKKKQQRNSQALNVPHKSLNTSSQSTRMHPLIFKRKWLSPTSSCISYCYILLWLGIPTLLKWNHLNPVGPAFVIVEGFSTRTIGGFLYTLTLDLSHYLCFTCSTRVCSGSVTKKVAYYHPLEKLSAHVRFGNCCRLRSRLNWTWHWAIIRKWNAVFAIMRVWQGTVNHPYEAHEKLI